MNKAYEYSYIIVALLGCTVTIEQGNLPTITSSIDFKVT